MIHGIFGEPVNTETANSKNSPNTFVQLPFRAMGGGLLGDRKKILLYKELGWWEIGRAHV